MNKFDRLVNAILFRGKNFYTGEWVEGHVYTQVFFPDSLDEEWNWYIKPIGSEICGEVKANPFTVGQYTGLKDRTGKKIFEGDIVRAETYHDYGQYGEKGESRYIVKWDEKRAMFYPFNIVDGDYLRLETFEVVGNIYDNPELIGGTKK